MLVLNLYRKLNEEEHQLFRIPAKDLYDEFIRILKKLKASDKRKKIETTNQKWFFYWTQDGHTWGYNLYADTTLRPDIRDQFKYVLDVYSSAGRFPTISEFSKSLEDAYPYPFDFDGGEEPDETPDFLK